MTTLPASRIALKRGDAPRRTKTLASVAILAASGIFISTNSLAGPAVRGPAPANLQLRLPTTTVWTNTRPQAGNFDAATTNGTPTLSGTAANPVQTITLLDAAGILRVDAADIGYNATVDVKMPSSTATLLVKPDGGFFQGKTVIEGILKADGQIYIYNPNGIIFGKTSEVNVNSLVATTLKIDDSRFLSGILSPSIDPVFKDLTATGSILVEGDASGGGKITAAADAGGGRILLIAPQVTNNGTLTAKDGQVILAGGRSVYLAAPTDTNMRGLIVEVGTKENDESAVNDVLGKISVGHGNATLVGMAVNQNGTISANTSVTLNGSVYLQARGGATLSSAGGTPSATVGGELVLGENSITRIDPDIADSETKANTGTAQKPSQVKLTGQHIVLERNASIIAHGGTVSIDARQNPSNNLTSQAHAFSASRVDFGEGSLIDVSGTKGTQLAMASNVIEVELRGTEFADNTLLRNSALRGQKAWIDIRKGTTIADVSGWINQVTKGVGERTATGGTVTVYSEGDIIQRTGAKIDVSGGWVQYLDGYVNTSKLIYNTLSYDIGSAPTNLLFTDLSTPTSSRSSFEKGYLQGFSAGSITFSAPAMVLQGTLDGSVTIGAKQRDVAATDRPLGGALKIGNIDTVGSQPDVLGSKDLLGFEGNIVIGTTTASPTLPALGTALDSSSTSSPLSNDLEIDVNAASASGFTRISAVTKGNIEVTGPLTLAAGSSLSLGGAGDVKFAAGVSAPGGKLTAIGGNSLTIADGAKFDLAGRWTNDILPGNGPRDASGSLLSDIVLGGGALSFYADYVTLGNNVAIDVSGGAALSASGTLSKGAGGSIYLGARKENQYVGSALRLGNGLDLSAYGLTQGGKLTLAGREVNIGGAAASPDDIGLDADFFTRGGFTSYNLTAQTNLTVADGTTLRPQAKNWQLKRAYATTTSGTMNSVASPTLLNLAGTGSHRPATSISLGAGYDLYFGTGASLVTDPKATVSLVAGHRNTIEGLISAPAGTIRIGLSTALPTDSDTNYLDDRSIWFGSEAQILAQGSTALISTTAAGISEGDILGGGSIQIGKFASDGSGSISAATGYLVAEAGSLFDVSGVDSQPVRMTTARNIASTSVLASDAGSIDMRAREGILFEGTLKGQAGNTNARGGRLTMVLDREAAAGSPAYPQQDRIFTLAASVPAGGIIPTGLSAGQSILGREGQGWLTLGAFSAGGFDQLNFKSQNIIAFATGNGILDLHSSSSLSLDAPVFRTTDSGTVRLSAAFVQLGNTDWRYQQTNPLASSGNATLEIVASSSDGRSGMIDLVGNAALQGFSNATLSAQEDVRLVGLALQKTDGSAIDVANMTPSSSESGDKLLSPYAKGSFSLAGDLSIKAAQTYVTTLSDYTLNISGTLGFSSNGKVGSMPLSALGKLTANAGTISQKGILRAPLGSITLNATNEIDYGANSLTSVAASGLIPLGFVQNGRDWIYDYGNGWRVNFVTTTGSGNNLLQIVLPEKSIVSNAPTVRAATGSQIDLSGGGDLYAYQFTSGPGGTKDVLSLATSGGNTFAILPGYSTSLAPRDAFYAQDNTLQPGDSIYLSGMDGLPAGFYTLLPAHYALLPGAYAVIVTGAAPGMSSSANQTNSDGSHLLAGYRLNSATGGADSRTSGFTVLSSDQVRARSEYTDYKANSFFTAQAAYSGVTRPMLPADGGHVVFNVHDALYLNGSVNLAADSGGASGIADISSSTDITVVADRSQSTAAGVILSAGELSALNADSLLLGGERYNNSDGTQHVAVNSTNITVGSDASHPLSLSAPDLILAAKDTVTVKAGANIRGAGTSARTPQDLTLVTVTVAADGSTKETLATGSAAEGALLRVTGSGAPLIHRGTPGASSGTLSIASGATVGASGGVVLDATKSFQMADILAFSTASALTIGASAISLGEGIPDAVGGLHFAGSSLNKLNQLTTLSLSSYASPIGFYTDKGSPFSLGNSSMKLTLQGQGIQAYGTGNASITAATLRLLGNNGSSFTPVDPSGHITSPTSATALVMTARDVEIGGSGSFRINGYQNVSVTATREVKGSGGSFSVTSGSADTATTANLTLAAGRLTAAAGNTSTISTDGILKLTRPAEAETDTSLSPLGGRLNFTGNTIVSDADIQVHAGQVNMTAAQGIEINGGSIDVSGRVVDYGSSKAYAPGGSIALNGGTGNINVASGAILDVSASGADAGTLTVSASNGSNATATIDGVLKGQYTSVDSTTTHVQGSFVLDVDKLAAFGDLNTKLNSAGFTESRNVRVRNDDLTLQAGETITARQTLLSADNGNITLAGTIDARGTKGGSIELYAAEAAGSSGKGKITLQSTALLDASTTLAASAVTSAAGSAGDGGRIVIGTATNGSEPTSVNGDASINIASGALLKVSGAGSGQGGTVVLRAPRVAANNNVAVSTTDSSTLGNAVQGARDFAIEGYKVYSATSITAADVETITNTNGTVTGITPSGTYYTDANTFLSADNKTSMQNRLGATGKLRAGIEVQSSGDLTVSVNETATNPQDRGWNLNDWRFGGEAGTLTLRAAGNLIVNGSISDGFTKPSSGSTAANKLGMPDWSLDSNAATNTSSWSYRLIGGADKTAANPLAVKASDSSGDFKLTFARTTGTANDQPVALIRTGTGRIDIAAGRDISLGSTTSSSKLYGAQIYTAGQASSTPGFTTPTNTLNTAYAATTSPTRAATAAAFGSNGGDISLYANHNIIGSATLQMVNNWLFRQGRLPMTGGTQFVNGAGTAWWSRYDYFNEGLATFGGGDISVVAATGNVKDISASTATDAWVAGTTTTGATLVEQGGGDLKVRAGGDILGGVFYVQKGLGNLRADGSIAEGGLGLTNAAWTGTQYLAPVLALGDATFNVVAGRDLRLEGAFNPTLADQSKVNLGGVSSFNDSKETSIPPQYSAFSTYTSNSAVNLTAVSGNLTLLENQRLMSAASNAGSASANEMPTAGTSGYLRENILQIMPGTLNLAALSGDILLGNGFSLWPSATGQLNLLAAGSIIAQKSLTNGWSQPLVMLDFSPDAAPTPLNPRKQKGTNGIDEAKLWSGGSDGLTAHTRGSLHATDSLPVSIVAQGGDIDFSATNKLYAPVLILPKSAQISAARDIRDLGFRINNLNTSDVTSISAGRDFIDTTNPTGTSSVSHTVGGPGRIDITAGRNFDLGNGKGLVTRGNLDNPYLPETGASINITAGAARADYTDFVARFSSLADFESGLKLSESSAFEQALVSFVRKYNPAISATVTPDEAWTAFSTLPVSQRSVFLNAQKPLINTVFFKALADSPISLGNDKFDLTQFDALIASIFPTASIKSGDINVFASQIKSERGGQIDLFTPGGSVYAGLVSVPVYLSNKSPSDLGIFTIKNGAIDALVKQDFLVNQGRLFTLGGGDITLISQYGNIDAGKGAKTASSAPPPLMTSDSNGNVVVNISGSISGSGIATLQTDPSVALASVTVVAPRGYFDAGDAGVRTGWFDNRSGGCLNCANISANVITGTPSSAATSGSSVPTAPANTATTRSDDLAKNLETRSGNTGSALNVEVIGFGTDQPAVTRSGQPAAPVPTSVTSPPSPDKTTGDEKKKSRKQP